MVPENGVPASCLRGAVILTAVFDSLRSQDGGVPCAGCGRSYTGTTSSSGSTSVFSMLSMAISVPVNELGQLPHAP
jgi:hypothetical protein